MATKFIAFMAELKREAKAEGPEAIADSSTSGSVTAWLAGSPRLAGSAAGRRRSWPRRLGSTRVENSTLESGQANPTYRTLQTLAAALGGRIELVIG